jgi:hypothetical protein
MNAHLLPCACCARHIRADEVFCPFCGERISLSRRDEPEFVLPPRRLTRSEVWEYRHGLRTAITAAAAFAAGGSLTLELACCSADVTAAYGACDAPACIEGGEIRDGSVLEDESPIDHQTPAETLASPEASADFEPDAPFDADTEANAEAGDSSTLDARDER